MRKSLFVLSLVVVLFSLSTTFGQNYSAEERSAYDYAYKNGITTISSIQSADMGGGLTRIAMAKMLSNYAINTLGLKPDTSKNCNFVDVDSKLDGFYDNGIKKACQLGLMGVGITNFNPNGLVTRAEFGTVLSRALNAKNADKVASMNKANPRYKEHLAFLKEQGVMKNISNPDQREIRGYVMIMLMRADKNSGYEDINVVDNNIPSFGELNDVVSTCWIDDMGGYNENIYKRSYILPYKDGYIGFEVVGHEGLNYRLTYKTKKDPCNQISTTDSIFWWNNNHKEMKENFGDNSHPDNELYYSYLGWGGPAQDGVVAKKLNCVPGLDMNKDNQCQKAVENYIYNLIIGKEQNDYFTRWLTKFKKDIDNGNYSGYKNFQDTRQECRRGKYDKDYQQCMEKKLGL